MEKLVTRYSDESTRPEAAQPAPLSTFSPDEGTSEKDGRPDKVSNPPAPTGPGTEVPADANGKPSPLGTFAPDPVEDEPEETTLMEKPGKVSDPPAC